MAKKSARVSPEEEVKREFQRQKEEPRYWIMIQRPREDTEDRVYVGVNGVSYSIEKGVRVPVPQSVIDALNAAEVDGYVPAFDDLGRPFQKHVREKRYPFTLEGPASPEEVEKWKAEQAASASQQRPQAPREEVSALL